MESESKARIFQSTMEWWKTVYDFYKHFMTIALASIAAFGALLGGAFRDAVGPNAGSMPRSLVLIAFIAFALTAILAVQGMHYARRSMLHMRDSEVAMRDFEGVPRLEDYVNSLEQLRNWWGQAVWYLVWFFVTLGVIAFIWFLFIAVLRYGVEQQTNL